MNPKQITSSQLFFGLSPCRRLCKHAAHLFTLPLPGDKTIRRTLWNPRTTGTMPFTRISFRSVIHGDFQTQNDGWKRQEGTRQERNKGVVQQRHTGTTGHHAPSSSADDCPLPLRYRLDRESASRWSRWLVEPPPPPPPSFPSLPPRLFLRVAVGTAKSPPHLHVITPKRPSCLRSVKTSSSVRCKAISVFQQFDPLSNVTG